MSIPTSYAILTVLEAELGRERVIAMAESYLNAAGPLRAPNLRVIIPPLQLDALGVLTLSPVLGPAPGGGPVTPPGFDFGTPLPAPRTDAAPRTPLQPILSPRTPPGAPPRPARPAYDPMQLGPTVEGGAAGGAPAGGAPEPDNQRAPEPNNELMELMRTDPENPLLCPRHEHIPRGRLGPTRNSSGNWGFYGPPPASGCRFCQGDAREDTLRNNMWAALAEAEHERTAEAIAATRAAMAAYDADGQGSPDRTYVERGLQTVEAMEAAAAAAAARVHYCGDADCDSRCGVLDCGCIDMCRGRCGTRDFDRDRGGW
jgi:hypothetical protein